MQEQVERDKFKLLYVMLQVPHIVVKSLHNLSRTGYERMMMKVSADASEGDEEQEEALASAHEVRLLAPAPTC